ncbi:hypothetical protein SHIRM173S_04254 [Streptomyces hirsutus]
MTEDLVAPSSSAAWRLWASSSRARSRLVVSRADGVLRLAPAGGPSRRRQGRRLAVARARRLPASGGLRPATSSSVRRPAEAALTRFDMPRYVTSSPGGGCAG